MNTSTAKKKNDADPYFDLELETTNPFQVWLVSQGYTRSKETGWAWMKDGAVSTAKDLVEKLTEWSALNPV